jgi:N-acetylmuramoyl-L-alanine amidase
MPKICLDPGHQTKDVDTGAQGNGLRESILTLDICQRIKPLLEFNGFEVVMTREGDTIPGVTTLNQSLQQRCYIANAAQANLFISVHVNAGGGTGTEVYICGRGGQAERLANIALYYLVQQCAWKDRGVKVANFYVLTNTAMPAILTENGFIDNASDAAKLADPDFRQRIAVAHAKAVCDYYGQTYKEKAVVKESLTTQSTQTDKVQQALSLLKQAINILEG